MNTLEDLRATLVWVQLLPLLIMDDVILHENIESTVWILNSFTFCNKLGPACVVWGLISFLEIVKPNIILHRVESILIFFGHKLNLLFDNFFWLLVKGFFLCWIATNGCLLFSWINLDLETLENCQMVKLEYTAGLVYGQISVHL